MSKSTLIDDVLSSKWAQFSIVGLVSIYLVKYFRSKSAIRKIEAYYRSRIEVAVRERDESIEWARNEATLASDDARRSIEKMDFSTLRESLQRGEVSVESVVRVYYGLAVAAHEKTNCLTKIVKEALTEARELDERAKDPSYEKPRLFGLPISIKDCIQLAGHRNTWGLAKQIDTIPQEDSYQVRKLRQDGMIPFCITNLSAACLSFTCINSIYGTTTNPHDATRTPGGSSGGEGALIAARGSLVGIGSDTCGSIRIPAAFSGCCGFKPSATRCSTLQYAEPFLMRPTVMTTEGPLASDPHTIVEIMRSMWSDHFLAKEDSLAVPVDFREDLFKKGTKYRVGYFTTDGYIHPLPGCQRVVGEAADLLKVAGHEIVAFSMEDIVRETASGIYATALLNGETIAEKLKDEPLTPGMEWFRESLSLPSWTIKMFGWMFQLGGDAKTADFMFGLGTSAAKDVQSGIDRVYAARKRLVQKMKEEQIDLILCPSTLGPAMPHALPQELPFPALFPTLMWNAMDFPAGVVTTGQWTEEDEAAMDDYEDKGMVEKGIKKGCRNSVGLPLSVQIAGLPFRDEMVLRAMVDLHEAIRK